MVGVQGTIQVTGSMGCLEAAAALTVCHLAAGRTVQVLIPTWRRREVKSLVVV